MKNGSITNPFVEYHPPNDDSGSPGKNNAGRLALSPPPGLNARRPAYFVARIRGSHFFFAAAFFGAAAFVAGAFAAFVAAGVFVSFIDLVDAFVPVAVAALAFAIGLVPHS